MGVLGAAGLIAAVCLFSNNALQVTEYERVFAVGKTVKIVHLSDLHAKTFGKDNARLVKKVARLCPQVIVFTGDIVHKCAEKQFCVAEKTVAALSRVAPVLFVSGNHEMRNKGYRELKKRLVAAGATVLDDEAAEKAGVKFTGINCAHIKNDTLFSLPSGADRALLAHYPHYFQKYASAGFGLVLCGHAHGGQWRIPFSKRGIYAPGQGFFPKYCCGEYRLGDSVMIVSRGLGNSEFPLRLFNRPEIVAITLKPETDNIS